MPAAARVEGARSDKRVASYYTRAEWAAVKAAARVAGQSPAEWQRDAALSALDDGSTPSRASAA